MYKYFFICVFICICLSADVMSGEASKQSSLSRRLDRLAMPLKICADDETRFRSIMRDVSALLKILSTRYGRVSGHKVVMTVMRILVYMCNQHCIQQAETLIKLVEVLSRTDLPSLNKFLDDLQQIFKSCSETGCFLLWKIEKLLMSKGKKPKTLIDFLHNITIFCKLMLEKGHTFDDICDSLNRLIQVYHFCFIYAEIIVKFQIIILKYYGSSKGQRVPNFFVNSLDLAIIMIQIGYHDILAEILDVLLRSTRKFDLCKKSFFEILEDIIGELLLLVENPCEYHLLQVVAEIEKVLCHCQSQDKHPRDSDEDDMYASGKEVSEEDEDEDDDYDEENESDSHSRGSDSSSSSSSDESDSS